MKIRDGGGIQESVGERGLFRPMIAPPPASCRTTPQPYQLAQSPFATFLSLSFLSFSLISFSAWLFMISCAGWCDMARRQMRIANKRMCVKLKANFLLGNGKILSIIVANMPNFFASVITHIL